MREWFKARNVWGAAIQSLSDEEAGCLAKAIWRYTMTGDVTDLTGAGKGVFAMIMMTLNQDEAWEADLSEKRALAGSIGGQHTQANRNKCKQTEATEANATNKNKNKSKKEEQESESESFMDDDDAHQIQIDHDRVLDAAEDAGFSMSNNVRASLIALYADHGLDKVLDGLRSCSEHGVTTLAYLRACMKDEQRKTVPIKAAVQAQNYSQRSYDGEQEDALRRMIRTVSG